MWRRIYSTIMIAGVAVLLTFTGCAAQTQVSSTETIPVSADAGVNIAEKPQQYDYKKLDELLSSLDIPLVSYLDLSLEMEDLNGNIRFPKELVNQLKRAFYTGNIRTWMEDSYDDELIVSKDDFAYVPSEFGENTYGESSLWEWQEALMNGAEDLLFYRIEANGDDQDEILIVNRIENGGQLRCAILQSTKEGYRLSGYTGFNDYGSFLGVFEYYENYYLMYEGPPGRHEIVYLISLSSYHTEDEDGTSFFFYFERMQIQWGTKYYVGYPLYENPDSEREALVRQYMDEILNDLITDDSRTVNRGFKGDGSYLVWTPKTYSFRQSWIQNIKGDSIIFTLYHKVSDDTYVLDARMYEDGHTIVLMDYLITPVKDLFLYADKPYGADKEEWAREQLERERYRSDLIEQSEQFAAKIKKEFSSAEYKDDVISTELILLLEQALYDDAVTTLDFDMSGLQIDSESFIERHYETFGNAESCAGSFMEYQNSDRFHHIYKYEMDQDTYYLCITDSYYYKQPFMAEIFRKSDGEFLLCDQIQFPTSEVYVIRYQGELYLVGLDYYPYTDICDTILLYQLVPEASERYVEISLVPESFQWKALTKIETDDTKEIEAFTDSIKEKLMACSSVEGGEMKLFTGNESPLLDKVKLQRLEAVIEFQPDLIYSEVDCNNDGITEYLMRKLSLSGSLYCGICQLENTGYEYMYKIMGMTMASVAFRERQIFFFETEGNVYTYCLYAIQGQNYYLVIYFVDGDEFISVQDYLISAQNRTKVLKLNKTKPK